MKTSTKQHRKSANTISPDKPNGDGSGLAKQRKPSWKWKSKVVRPRVAALDPGGPYCGEAAGRPRHDQPLHVAGPLNVNFKSSIEEAKAEHPSYTI